MIDPVGSASSASATNVTGFRSRLQDVTTAVAKELGMSTDDLEQQLRAGASLDDVAKANGVSHDDLVATITQALQGSSASGDTQAPSALDQLAQRIASAHPHHHGHHHHKVAGTSDASGVPGAQAAQPSDPTLSTSPAPLDPGIGTVIDALG
jgi:hypothetical protein